MTKIQKASLLASTLSILWIGLFSGQALARYANRETFADIPIAGDIKVVVIPRLERDLIGLSQPRIQTLPVPSAELPAPSFPTFAQPVSQSTPSRSNPNAKQSQGSSSDQVAAPTSQSVTPRPSPGQNGFAVINASNTRIRLDPSTTAAKIGIGQKGETGQILERRAGWTRLLLANRGMSGWIRDDLLVIP